MSNMSKFYKLFAAVGLCMAIVPGLSAQRITPGAPAAEKFSSVFMLPGQSSGIYKFSPRRSSGLLESFTNRNHSISTPLMAPSKAPGDINLIGYVLTAKAAGYGFMNNIPYREGAGFSQISPNYIYNTWGGIEVAGEYYTTVQMMITPTSAYNYLYTYDSSTWAATGFKQLEDFSLFATALGKNPFSDEVYGCFLNEDYSKYEFGIADFANATRTTICEIDGQKPWTTCVFDSEGTLYVVDKDGDLSTVDPATGKMTLIGSTGIPTMYLTGSCYDSARGRILRAVCNDDFAGLYEIDPATAEVSLLSVFPNNEQVMGLYIGAPLAAAAAPEVPADITAEFPYGNLTGTVSFTIPTVTFGGQVAEGDINWTVYGFYQTLASGTARPGDRVVADVTVPYPGQAKFTVTLSNEAGASPKGECSCFVGRGTPTIPLPKITNDNGLVTITWEPVTTTYEGGYIDPEEVTYTVTRSLPLPSVVVAEHIKETTFTEQLEIPDQLTTYQYWVVAENGDKQSGLGSTLPFVLGTQGVPYINDLSQINALQYCTAYDANDDGYTWQAFGLGATIMDYYNNIPVDDWLFTPGITLEEGHSYYTEFTFNTYPGLVPFDPADIEIKYGDLNSPASMNATLVPFTPADKLAAKPATAVFRAEKDGPCYIGIHAFSPETNWVQLTKIVVKDAAMPDSITDLTIGVDPYPSLTAKIKFNAPAVTAAGDKLESIDRIEVTRGGVLIKTFENPAPGETLAFEDVVGTGAYASGNYQWIFTPINSAGDGLQVSRIAYVGLDAPAMPETVTAVEDGNTGSVTISWSEVTTDVHGRPLAPEYIKYRILNSGAYVDEDPVIVNNSYTYQVCDPSTQDFAQMGVQLYNERSSTVAFTPVMPVGKPYGNYSESFVDGKTSHPIALIASEHFGMWSPVQDGYYDGFYSADNDGGFLALSGGDPGTLSVACLGKFNLDNMEKPQLSMMVMNIWNGIDGEYNENTIGIFADNGQGYKLINTISCDVHGECEPGAYVKRSVDLSSLVGKGDVTIAMCGILNTYTLLVVDRIKVAPVYDHNLSLMSVTSPAAMSPALESYIYVAVENNGLKTAENYTVTLFRDGEEVGTIEGAALAPDASVVLTFKDEVSVLSPAQVEYSAIVNYDLDRDISDNTGAGSISIVNLPNYPAPEALTGAIDVDGNVALSWTEPATVIAPEAVTESFENGAAFAVDNYGDWTFVDLDGEYTYSFSSISFEGAQGPMAYVVYEPRQYDFVYLSAVSGQRFLVANGVDGDGTNDDWAISPALSENAQTVTLYARSLFIEDGGESFRFLYSTGSLDPKDFIEVERVDGVPAAWTFYSFDIPAGAKYFAINCVSEHQYMFMVDDVTYVPASVVADVSLLGYNVYRDGAKVNESLVAESAYTDIPELNGEYKYEVTAVYDKGESVGSNAVSVSYANSGVASAVVSGVSVVGGKGEIVVTGARDLEIRVVAVDGRTVAIVPGTDRVVIPVASGVYVVMAGSRSVKTIVR